MLFALLLNLAHASTDVRTLCTQARSVYLANVEGDASDAMIARERKLMGEIKARGLFAKCEAQWYPTPKDKVLEVALADPDAFDSMRVRDEGVAYVCADEYSDQLTKLCKEIRKLNALTQRRP